MKLKKGVEAIALIKASMIVLVTDFAGYTLSARNQLAGTISRLEKGAVSSLVGVTLPGGAVVTASVTNDAVDALALAVGQEATAVFKAYSVMVAVANGFMLAALAVLTVPAMPPMNGGSFTGIV